MQVLDMLAARQTFLKGSLTKRSPVPPRTSAAPEPHAPSLRAPSLTCARLQLVRPRLRHVVDAARDSCAADRAESDPHNSQPRRPPATRLSRLTERHHAAPSAKVMGAFLMPGGARQLLPPSTRDVLYGPLPAQWRDTLLALRPHVPRTCCVADYLRPNCAMCASISRQLREARRAHERAAAVVAAARDMQRAVQAACSAVETWMSLEPGMVACLHVSGLAHPEKHPGHALVRLARSLPAQRVAALLTDASSPFCRMMLDVLCFGASQRHDVVLLQSQATAAHANEAFQRAFLTAQEVRNAWRGWDACLTLCRRRSLSDPLGLGPATKTSQAQSLRHSA
jgi:hypothetical protein